VHATIASKTAIEKAKNSFLRTKPPIKCRESITETENPTRELAGWPVDRDLSFCSWFDGFDGGSGVVLAAARDMAHLAGGKLVRGKRVLAAGTLQVEV
jgi:hypothetical protein